MTDTERIARDLVLVPDNPRRTNVIANVTTALGARDERIAALEAELAVGKEKQSALLYQYAACHEEKTQLEAELAEWQASALLGEDSDGITPAHNEQQMVSLRAKVDELTAELGEVQAFRAEPLKGIRELIGDEGQDDEAMMGSVMAILLTRHQTAQLYRETKAERDELALLLARERSGRHQQDAEIERDEGLDRERLHGVRIEQLKAERDALALALRDLDQSYHPTVGTSTRVNQRVLWEAAREALTTPGASRVLRELEALRALAVIEAHIPCVEKGCGRLGQRCGRCEALAAVEQARR